LEGPGGAKEAEHRPQATHLMKQPGVRPVAVPIGTIAPFQRSKQVVSYLGLNPSEESNGGKQRLGSISKQDKSMMRHFLVEAAQ
jgi:transposase